MENYFLFPHIVVDKNLLEDGDWISTPVFCRKRFSEKCHIFYKDIYNSPGAHKCPCGLSCYVNIYDGSKIIYTGLRINSFYNRKKTKYILKDDYSPLFTLPVFEKIVKTTNLINKGLQQERRNIVQKRKVTEEFIKVTIHEVRKLNSHIKAQSEELSKVLDFSPDNLERINYLQRNIFSTSSLISMRLDAFDFRANPELLEKQKPYAIPIFKRFDKIRHCLKVEQEGQDKRIVLTGDSKLCVLGYEIFDMLPFVLLDNAIKFSPPNESINVTFFEEEKKLTITIHSKGPPLDHGEETKVFEEFYRGKYAKNESTGSGLGLSVAKKICDIHRININVRSMSSSGEKLFIVTLVFDPERLCYHY